MDRWTSEAVSENTSSSLRPHWGIENEWINSSFMLGGCHTCRIILSIKSSIFPLVCFMYCPDIIFITLLDLAHTFNTVCIVMCHECFEWMPSIYSHSFRDNTQQQQSVAPPLSLSIASEQTHLTAQLSFKAIWTLNLMQWQRSRM